MGTGFSFICFVLNVEWFECNREKSIIKTVFRMKTLFYVTVLSFITARWCSGYSCRKVVGSSPEKLDQMIWIGKPFFSFL